jgi:hypothetical protein
MTPPAQAVSTADVNLRTSTITSAATWGASRSTPCGPQSKRASKPCCVGQDPETSFTENQGTP